MSRRRQSNKEVARMLQQCEQLGATIAHHGKHIQIKVLGGGIVTLSASPSDHRALANMRGELRRAGARI